MQKNVKRYPFLLIWLKKKFDIIKSSLSILLWDTLRYTAPLLLHSTFCDHVTKDQRPEQCTVTTVTLGHSRRGSRDHMRIFTKFWELGATKPNPADLLLVSWWSCFWDTIKTDTSKILNYPLIFAVLRKQKNNENDLFILSSYSRQRKLNEVAVWWWTPIKIQFLQFLRPMNL